MTATVGHMDHDSDQDFAATAAANAARDTGTAAEWDERYSSADRLWTSNVNPALIAEAGALTPGTALDVGSGEGADARWLAARGWTVVAIDISGVAIERARSLDTTGAITWAQVDLYADDVPAPGTFDLVSAQYFPIAAGDETTVARLLGAVAPGGSLVMSAHEPTGIRAQGRDPDAYIFPGDVAARIADDPDWEIVTDETRERGIAAGGGHHTHDVILRARRIR